MVGGLAAGGLGAAIKYTPKRQVDPFAAATAEDPDDAMPDDEPLPAWAAAGSGGGRRRTRRRADGAEARRRSGRTPVSDEVLNLLYRGGLEPAPFSGRLREWTDGEVVGGAMLGAVPESARRAGFGGVGFLVDTIFAVEDCPARLSTRFTACGSAGGTGSGSIASSVRRRLGRGEFRCGSVIARW